MSRPPAESFAAIVKANDIRGMVPAELDESLAYALAAVWLTSSARRPSWSAATLAPAHRPWPVLCVTALSRAAWT
jgi:hypothetical protein